ncbi:aspartate/glutamate racemase family protein, partial [Petrocella sp. FN5]|uniref:aspartate/glutamate racemase family protein n=1 Tax=Petrocella sp. FN5 TaxID=3032002 RepID=UPI0023DBEC1B
VEVIVPTEAEQGIIHDVIYNELVQGIVKTESKKEYIKIIQGLVSRGAEGIILGCTEIPMLIKKEDIEVELFDTTAIHATFAVDFALSE